MIHLIRIRYSSNIKHGSMSLTPKTRRLNPDSNITFNFIASKYSASLQAWDQKFQYSASLQAWDQKFNTLRCCWKRRDMSESNIIFFVGIITLVSAALAADDPQITYLGSGCGETVNSTWRVLTTFNQNQAAVFESLASNLSSNGSHFATSLINNRTTDPVYGLFQCREYLTTNECLECFTAAKDKVKELCPRSNGAKLHLDGCFLRFENRSFVDEGGDGGDTENCSGASDTQDFSVTAQKLLNQLIENASTNDGYAVSSNNSIYALVQCVKSLDNDTCQECLTKGYQRLITNCLPRQEGHALMAGCFMRYANYAFFPDNLSASPENQGRSQSKRVPILLGSIGGAGLFAALCVGVICRYRKRFKGFIPVFAKAEDDLRAREAMEQVTIFNYKTLRDATADFDPNNLLGKGGFGEVYKGKLIDGKVIAVKKLSGRQTTQAMNEFLTEVKLISSVRHRNLVRLLGCCSHGHDRLLVYEFMSNNSLDKHLFGDRGIFLEWETRLNIIVGTARGLAYLHEDSNNRIVHRDIKPGNILLDDKFLPKIADFGFAKFFPEGESHVFTNVGGTIGYTAPEYIVRGQLSEKADVYSFGVVVLEIVSGRKCLDERLPDPLQLLLQWIWQLYESEQILDMADPKLKGEYPKEQMVRVITIALLCVKASPSLRPTMTQVVSMLTSGSEISDQPTKPAFLDSNVNEKIPTSSSMDSAGSHGSVTASLIAR